MLLIFKVFFVLFGMFGNRSKSDNMTYSYIEKRENDFKNKINTLNQKIELANSQIELVNRQVEYRDELLVEIVQDIDNKGELSENTLQKIRAFTKELKLE